VETAPDLATCQIHACGRVEGLTEEAQLLPELRGRVVRIAVKEGDRVEAGAVLIELDGSVQEHEAAICAAELENAEARLQRLINGARAEERQEAAALLRALQAELAGVRKRLERYVSLRVNNSATQQQVDDTMAETASLEAKVQAAKARSDLLEAPAREDEVRRAESEVAAARARLAMAHTQCEKMSIRAPHAATAIGQSGDHPLRHQPLAGPRLRRGVRRPAR
jgi:HlyD family secretion protein